MFGVAGASSGLSRLRGRVGNWTEFARTRTAKTPPAWVLVVALVAALTWSINPVPPAVGGYDISWITGLVVAAHRGFHWGSQINYTYGPLGYLTIGNFFYDLTGLEATIVIGATYVGLLTLLARPACRVFGWALGGLLVFVLAKMAAAPIDAVELQAPVLVAMGILAIRRGSDLRPWSVVGISAFAAFSCLDKLSVAPIAVSVVFGLAVVGAVEAPGSQRDRVKAAVLPIGSFIAAFLLLWLVAGQSLFDLPSYLRNGLETINGYDDAEAVSTPSINWEYIWAAVSLAAVGAAVFWTDRGQGVIRRVVIGVLWLVFSYTAFRHAFVRFTPGHAVLFFAPLALLAGAVLILPGRWRAGLGACLVLLAATWQVGTWNLPNLFTASTGGLVSEINFLLAPNLRHGSESGEINALRATYGLTPALLSRMNGQTVQFDPFEATIAWAYPEIKWDPPPVFQSYNAYTSHLDDLNAAFLNSPRGPRYILREDVSVDGRDPRADSPRYMLEMMCRYRQVMQAGNWALLERGPNRCGTPTPAGSQQAQFDQRVGVPSPTANSIVVASFSNFRQPLADALEGLVFKRRIQYMAENQAFVRFVPGTAVNPHVMTVPTCLGWTSAAIDPTRDQWIALGHMPELSTPLKREPDYGYRVTFERIPFRCSA